MRSGASLWESVTLREPAAVRYLRVGCPVWCVVWSEPGRVGP
jgi:hypothetical protein